jgi:diaminopimelate decarboxylase
MTLQIFVSGVHSGPNPSPGVGVARSLRQAFAGVRLIGVDYSPRSTGLSWPDFDEVIICTPWNSADLERQRDMVEERMQRDAVWISGLDLETIWMAAVLPGCRGLLIPSNTALVSTRKPGEFVANALAIGVPPTVSLSASDLELHAFCRQFGWNVWLKGPWYEATRISSWLSLQQAYQLLANTWGEQGFAQCHIDGVEESIAFCAHQGRMLDAVYMKKREITAEGKTWSGKIESVPDDLHGRLAELIAELRWTGGGEVEMVRDARGDRWLLELNPRFPAWIFGATLAGHNMPAKLVQAECGGEIRPEVAVGCDFTRVVIEIPVHRMVKQALAETEGEGT